MRKIYGKSFVREGAPFGNKNAAGKHTGRLRTSASIRVSPDDSGYGKSVEITRPKGNASRTRNYAGRAFSSGVTKSSLSRLSRVLKSYGKVGKMTVTSKVPTTTRIGTKSNHTTYRLGG